MIESITWQLERDGEWPNEARKDAGLEEMVGQRDDQYKGRVQWGEESPTTEWSTDEAELPTRWEENDRERESRQRSTKADIKPWSISLDWVL